MKCIAETQRPKEAPIPCDLDATCGTMCYYHNKMFHGNIKPYFEDAVVRGSNGISIYTPRQGKRTI